MRSLARKYSRTRPRHYRRPILLLSVACWLCLTALLLVSEAAPATGRAIAAAPVIKVTLGGADDHTILLSKGTIGPGKVTFNVRNTGKKKHSFSVCLGTTYSATANSCIGDGTKKLAHGTSASLTVDLSEGIHEYLSTVPGDAKAGMKGGLDVQQPALPAPVDTTADTPCPNPQTTTVTVTEVDYVLTVTPTTVPCGTVIFMISNNSEVSQHNFSITRYGSVRAVGDVIDPKNVTTLTAKLGPGSHPYQSDDPVDAIQGMKGTLKVT
jgi:uncharacterized cupredoxin-like copper-binding protein